MKETTYEHEAGREYFAITAAERWSISMIKKLHEKHPDEVEITQNKDGSIYARVPLSWMRIHPKRTRTMTDEERAAAAERLRKGREQKKLNQ